MISRNLTNQDLGYYKLNVIAVESVRDQTFTYKKEMYLFVYAAEQEEIIEPDKQVPEIEKTHIISKFSIKREEVSEDSILAQALSLDPTGVLRIGWYKEMVPPEDLSVISEKKLKVKAQSKSLSDRRVLSQNETSQDFDRIVIVDEDEATLNITKNLIMTLDNIDVQLLDEYGDIRLENPRPQWSIVSFSPTEIEMKLDFVDEL